MPDQRNVAILLFDEVEVLDFAGPFEVFAVCREEDEPPFNVYTVSHDGQPISARHGLRIDPAFSFGTALPPDIVVIPGGAGTRPLLTSDVHIDWIRQQARNGDLTLSVCTGSLLLAKAGLLFDKGATTYHTAFERLQELEPTVTVHRDQRWVDNGDIITSAGVSAGIDMALYVVGKLLGEDVAAATARKMEYTHYQPTS